MGLAAFNRMRRERAEAEKQAKDATSKPIDKMTVAELEEMAKEKNLEGFENMKKAELVAALTELVVKDNDGSESTGGDEAQMQGPPGDSK